MNASDSLKIRIYLFEFAKLQTTLGNKLQRSYKLTTDPVKLCK